MMVLDMYSGLGGFSEAFVRDPDWDVLRIENNHLLADVPHTMIADVLTLNPSDFQCDLLLASPPCTEFSQGFAGPGPTARRKGIDFKPNMDLVKCAVEWDRVIKPKYFLMENVVGSAKYFAEVGVKKIMTIGPFCLYGRFPSFEMPQGWSHSKTAPKEIEWDFKHPLRANYRGKLPLELSEKIKLVFESQPTLGVWS